MKTEAQILCPVEERINFVTHFIGFLLSCVGVILLVTFALWEVEGSRVLSRVVYGATLIGMYGASSWYHRVLCQKKRQWLRRLDHASIYLLIAGSYTPYSVGPLLYAIWGIAIVGVFYKLLAPVSGSWLSLFSYLLMGWLVVLGFPTLLEELSLFSLVGLVMGGLFYTVGAVFYMWRSLPYHHGIWHLFVLLGSASHFFSVLAL